MEVTEKVTPTAIRLVVTTSKNVLYVANLTETQLQECIENYGLKWKRPRGRTSNLEQINSEEKENADANADQP